MHTALKSNSSQDSSTILYSNEVVSFLKSVDGMPEELFLNHPEFYKLKEFKERMLPMFEKNIK